MRRIYTLVVIIVFYALLDYYAALSLFGIKASAAYFLILSGVWVINFLTTLVLSGVISASGAVYLLDIMSYAEVKAQSYEASTAARFKVYQKMLPGTVGLGNSASQLTPKA